MIAINSLELWQNPQIHSLIKAQYFRSILTETRSGKLTYAVKPNRQFQQRLHLKYSLLRSREDFIMCLHHAQTPWQHQTAPDTFQS